MHMFSISKMKTITRKHLHHLYFQLLSLLWNALTMLLSGLCKLGRPLTKKHSLLTFSLPAVNSHCRCAKTHAPTCQDSNAGLPSAQPSSSLCSCQDLYHQAYAQDFWACRFYRHIATALPQTLYLFLSDPWVLLQVLWYISNVPSAWLPRHLSRLHSDSTAGPLCTSCITIIHCNWSLLLCCSCWIESFRELWRRQQRGSVGMTWQVRCRKCLGCRCRTYITLCVCLVLGRQNLFVNCVCVESDNGKVTVEFRLWF